MFQDEAFRTRHCLGSVNSVNALRLLVQVVHFFYAYFQVTADQKPLDQPLEQPLDQPLDRPLQQPLPKVCFAIPTGAAGHVTAGLIAKLMGLPIDELVMAVNANDVLHTMMTDGVLVKGADVHHTASPAMDIQVHLYSTCQLILINNSTVYAHCLQITFTCALCMQSCVYLVALCMYRALTSEMALPHALCACLAAHLHVLYILLLFRVHACVCISSELYSA